ncbi:MAG: hypothetical protein QOJ79_1636 [Actinomycetota bacterium]|jgi:hypothetical protein|nr:hypothetical protein [Actinomycetota bacterium]
MRPAARWISVAAIVGVAGVPVLLATSPAWADAATPVPSYSNWYWSGKDGAASTVTGSTPVGNGPFAAPDQASGVPDGDLGVAYTNDVDKVAAINFGLQSIPDGATVTKFAVVMPLDTTASNLAATDGPAITACPAIAPFEPAIGPTELSKAPAQAANVCIDGKYDATAKTYTFDIATAADDWSAGAPANGIVIRPKLGESTQFNYAFKGINAIKVTADYSAAANPVVAPAAPVDTGSGVAAPPALDSGSVSIPAVQPVTPVAPQPQVMPAPAPVVAAPNTAPVAATIHVDALRPSGQFWLALLGLAVMLLLAAFVLGDPMDPVVVDARRRRFAEIVRARAAARATAPAGRRPATTPRARHA